MNKLYHRVIEATKNRHATMLVVGLLVVTLPFVLETNGETKVELVYNGGVSLPMLCTSKALFGVDCPGCGLTRSVVHFSHGRFHDSWRMHQLGWLMYLAAGFQIPHRLLLLSGRRGLVNHRYSIWFGNLLIAALILSWLYKQAAMIL